MCFAKKEDDTFWFLHFSDSSFVYGRALAQSAGTAIMRLADADVIPFAFQNLAATAGRYARELVQLRDKRADQIIERNREIEDGVFALLSDPRDPTYAPAREEPAPRLNFAPLLDAVDALTDAAAKYDAAVNRALAAGPVALAASGNVNDATNWHMVNQRLLGAERALTDTSGLKNRSWYRHLLYAPGFYTGYGVKTMPGIREAVEQGDWKNADREILRVADALQREAHLLTSAVDLLPQSQSAR